MNIIKSMFSAFLMYSKIPVPQVKWCDKNRRYSLCFFPLIGAVIGGVMLLWKYISALLRIGNTLFAAVAVLIPIAVTGGIHMDGFCDVSDAKASYAEREKKLEIMSDSHIGAFAAISLGAYFILQFGLFSETLTFRKFAVVVVGFVLSRAISGIAAVSFKAAKNDGNLQSFSRPAHKKITITVLAVISIVSASFMIILSPICGIPAIFAALIVFVYYRNFSYERFGGITGDLAGYFLQICELAMLAAVVFSDKIAGVIVR